MKISAINKLASHIEALRSNHLHPSFWLQCVWQTYKPNKSKLKNIRVHEGLGYVNFKTKLPETAYSIEQFLSLFTASNKQSVLVLKDIHHYLNNPKVISLQNYSIKECLWWRLFCDNVHCLNKIGDSGRIGKLITVFDTPLPEKQNYQIDSEFCQW